MGTRYRSSQNGWAFIDCPSQLTYYSSTAQTIPSPTTTHLQLPTIPQTTQDVYTSTKADQCDTQKARKYGTTGPNSGPDLPQPTGHETTRNANFIVVEKQDNLCYMLHLYLLHTRPPTLCKTKSRSALPTLIIRSIFFHVHRASLKKIVSNMKMATAGMAETCS